MLKHLSEEEKKQRIKDYVELLRKEVLTWMEKTTTTKTINLKASNPIEVMTEKELKQNKLCQEKAKKVEV